MVDVWLVSNGNYWKAAWRDAAGVQHGKGLGAKAGLSKRAAGVLCRRISAELSNPAPPKPDAPRLSAWIDRYVGQRADVAEKTRRTYRECAVYLRLFFDKDPPVNEITRAAAAEWRADLASGELTARLNELAYRDPARYRNPASGRAWIAPKPATVALHTRVAKLLFRAAVDQDLCLFNPFDRLKGNAPRVRRDWRQVTPGDMGKIFDACPDAAWRCLFALCRYAGLRLGEARRLRWGDIEWDANRLRVNADAAKDTTKVRPRTCPIEPAEAPTGLYAVLRDAFTAAPPGSAGPCAAVRDNNVYRIAFAVLRRALGETYSKPFHTLRKCREGELAARYPQHVVCEWQGHGVTVSAEHYLRVPAELYRPPPGVWTQIGGEPVPGESESSEPVVRL